MSSPVVASVIGAGAWGTALAKLLTDQGVPTLIWAREPEVVEDVHVNPLARHREIWLRDPDGYVVVVSSPYGDVG